MRAITKNSPPKCLSGLQREAARIRRDTGTLSAQDWAPGACAQPIREALCAEQSDLCAYCARQIAPNPPTKQNRSGMKIEHVVARTADVTKMYTWRNLVGTCTGVTDTLSARATHCDESKGDRPLSRSPVGRVAPVSFTKSGRVEPGGLSQADIDLLNLNADFLVAERKDAIDWARAEMSRIRGRGQYGRFRAQFLPNSGRRQQPHAPIILWYLDRKPNRWKEG